MDVTPLKINIRQSCPQIHAEDSRIQLEISIHSIIVCWNFIFKVSHYLEKAPIYILEFSMIIFPTNYKIEW